MAEDDVSLKKIKLEQVKISKDVLCEHKDVIQTAIHELKKSIERSFASLRIISCNGDFGVSFSNAWCGAIRNIDDSEASDEQKRLTHYADVFDVEKILKSFDDPSSSELSRGQTVALNCLGNFLNDLKEANAILGKKETYNEAEWAVILANHLLSDLSVCHQCMLSDEYTKVRTCPCSSESCVKRPEYGDTSIGHTDVWHGSVDILLGHLGPFVAVTTTYDPEDTESDEVACEMELHSLTNTMSRVIAETIVFAFVQQLSMTFTENLSTLIPSIAISKNTLKIFMFDPENDMLFESTDFDLFQTMYDSLNKRTVRVLDIVSVVAIWLAVNHRHFCKGIKLSHKEHGYKANFLSALKDKKKISIYRESLGFGQCKPSPQTDSLRFYRYMQNMHSFF